MKKTAAFTTVKEQLNQLKAKMNLGEVLNELERITQIIERNFPELVGICHCGAFSQEEDLMVLFVSSNSAFYQLNHQIASIQAVLWQEGVYFSKIAIKRRLPEAEKVTRKNRLNEEQYQMLEKFARAIEREDLLKPREGSVAQEDPSPPDWLVTL